MQVFADMARSALVSESGSTIVVEDGARFPVATRGAGADGPGVSWFKVVLQRGADFEVCHVHTHTGSGAFADVLRGQDGTAQQAWIAGDTQVTLSVMAADLAEIKADPRLSDSRPPKGGAGGVLSGSYPNPGFAVDMATQAELDAVAAAKVDKTDARLSDARAPTAHSHAIGDVADLQAALNGKLSDAPSDGKQYGRKDGGWVEASAGLSVALAGPTMVEVNKSASYTLAPYSSFSTYSVTASAGSASISGATVSYTAPATEQAVTLTVMTDGRPTTFAVTILPPQHYIDTPTPTPANFGDPLEGGFYAGMIWNELVQSATSTTIGTGSKTFTVPNMAGAPIVYQGQMLEVRSRANPANKMMGTVTGASGTQMTINVASVGGSGMFADWSVMSRYRVIVAPKASGENASVAPKNAITDLPVACRTLNEGLRATQAMRDADSASVYPAAHWARGLNIGGRTDWYIPARDELELMWRNLKPVTEDNTLTPLRATNASYDYKVNGAYGDTAATHGTNNNSAPPGTAYTAGVPAQTDAAAFKTGGSEAFEYGSASYWSSSESSTTAGWIQAWTSSSRGVQYRTNKAVTYRARAVRRSIV